MDGNGRWAAKRGLPRAAGHKEGALVVEDIIDGCCGLGVKVLTLYAFSTENWKRPRLEIETLMTLLCTTLQKKEKELNRLGVRLIISGRRKDLSGFVNKQLDASVARLSKNTGMVLNLALNYGARQEITDAVNSLLASGVKHVTEQDIEKHLYTAGLPDPDLLIRTSGERRISNFLLWQAAYSEFYFTELFWPEFRKPQLYEAVKEYQTRHRRFGGI